MTVVHHVLSAAALVGLDVAQARPALISIRPTEPWTGATAGKLKMHHVIHPLNDSHHIRELTAGDKSSQKDLDGSPVWSRCQPVTPGLFVMIRSASQKHKQKRY